MSEDLFSIQEIRSIILSFPQETVSCDTNDDLMLLPSANGEGFLAKHHVRNKTDELLHGAESRFSLGEVANRLEVDVNCMPLILSSHTDILGYDFREQHLIPWPELKSIIQKLQSLAAKSFVLLVAFCRENDICNESLLRHVRSLNSNGDGESRLGTGRWYENDDPPSNVYIYSETLLKKNRDEILLQVRLAGQNQMRKAWEEHEMRGLDIRSFRCLVLKLVEDAGYDSGQVTEQQQSNRVTFTPNSYFEGKRKTVIDSMLDCGCMDLRKIVETSPELFPDVESLTSRLSDTYGNEVTIIRSVAALETYLIEHASDPVLPLLEYGFAKAIVPVPEGVDATVLQPKFTLHVKMLAKQEDRNIELNEIEDYLVTSDWLSMVTSASNEATLALADRDWNGYAANPSKIPYPSLSSNTLHALKASSLGEIKSRLSNSSTRDSTVIIPEDLLETIYHKSMAKSAERLYKDAVRRKDYENEQAFKSEWDLAVMARLQIWKQGALAITEMKLRNDLIVLLNDHLTTEFLASQLDKLRPCGRNITTAIEKLKVECANFKSTDDVQNDLAVITAFYNATQRGLAQIAKDTTTADAAAIKAKELSRLRGDALQTYNDNADEGGRLFLLTLLILLANHQEGIVYATGRFVPRLLKQLKEKIEGTQYSRLQELKDEAKAGILSAQGKNDLAMMLLNDSEVDSGARRVGDEGQ